MLRNYSILFLAFAANPFSAFSEESQPPHLPAYKVDIVDTTGVRKPLRQKKSRPRNPSPTYRELMKCFSMTKRFNSLNVDRRSTPYRLISSGKNGDESFAEQDALLAQGKRPFQGQELSGVYAFNQYGACFYPLSAALQGRQSEPSATERVVEFADGSFAKFRYEVLESGSDPLPASLLKKPKLEKCQADHLVTDETDPDPKDVLVSLITENFSEIQRRIDSGFFSETESKKQLPYLRGALNHCVEGLAFQRKGLVTKREETPYKKALEMRVNLNLLNKKYNPMPNAVDEGQGSGSDDGAQKAE